MLFACLVGGCLYWILFAWLTPHVPLPDSSALPARFDGTIIESVRHSPGRLTALVEVMAIDDPAFEVPFHLRGLVPDHMLGGNLYRAGPPARYHITTI